VTRRLAASVPAHSVSPMRRIPNRNPSSGRPFLSKVNSECLYKQSGTQESDPLGQTLSSNSLAGIAHGGAAAEHGDGERRE
jgi:hypothetical protein